MRIHVRVQLHDCAMDDCYFPIFLFLFLFYSLRFSIRSFRIPTAMAIPTGCYELIAVTLKR